MKNFYEINRALVAKKHFNFLKQIFFVLTLFVIFGVNNVWAAWEGSGVGEEHNGKWYVVYQDSYEDLNTIETGPTIEIKGPGAKLIYTARGSSSLTGAGVKYFYYSYSTDKGSNWTDVGQNLTTSNSQYEGNLPVNANALRFRTKTGSTLTKYVSNIRVEMAQYVENPSTTSIAFGSAKPQRHLKPSRWLGVTFRR